MRSSTYLMSDSSMDGSDFIVQDLNDLLHDKDVRTLVMAAHIVHLAHAPAAGHHVDGLAVVLHIQPIAHVHAVAVHGQAFFCFGVVDHQRDKLFRELVRTIVVGAAGNVHRHAVGIAEGLHEQVCARLAGGVGAVGVQRSGLHEIACLRPGCRTPRPWRPADTFCPRPTCRPYTRRSWRTAAYSPCPPRSS